jgi:hypothetical protein
MAEKPIIDKGDDIERTGKRGRNLDLKLDPHGLPLSPQPSSFHDDPLVSFYGLFNTAQYAEKYDRTGRGGSEVTQDEFGHGLIALIS